MNGIEHGGTNEEPLFYRVWGSGAPLIALHPLALESSAFSGLASALGQRGIRTLAVDLPGFGRSLAGEEDLTAARLAEPVIKLAQGLETPPLILGMSLGGRVALEAALQAPQAFRGLALVAPYLPWRHNRWMLGFGRVLSPELGERLPLDRAWPLLKLFSERMGGLSAIEHDWFARASLQVAYYMCCSATRRHMFSAARALTEDPAEGEDGTWTRLATLEVPARVLWAGQDYLIPATHAAAVAEVAPAMGQLRIDCCGHFIHQGHYDCFTEAMTATVEGVIEDAVLRELGPVSVSASRTAAWHTAADRTAARHAAKRRSAARHSGATKLCPCVKEQRAAERKAGFAASEGTAGGATGDVTSDATGDATGDVGAAQKANPRSGTMRRLSGEDSIFVSGETATMPMHTMGVLILDPSTDPDGTFSFDRVVRMLRRRVHLMPPYRQRLIEVPFGLDHAVLADDPEFDVANHIYSAQVEGAGTLDDLADFVGRVAGGCLDRNRPLWEMYYVEGLEHGRVALVAKMHHCMIDGASGANQMANFLDLEAEPEPDDAPPPWDPAPLPTRIGLAARAFVPSVPKPGVAVSLFGRIATSAYRSLPSVSTLVSPSAMLESAQTMLTGAPAEVPGSGSITRNRSVAFSRAMLADVKLVKKAYGVTVNDVVLTACAIALREYLARLDRLPDRPVLCGVPVSIKSEEEKQEFSNRVSIMSVALPMEEMEPEELILRVHEESELAKARFSASDSDLLNELIEYVPVSTLGVAASAFSDWKLADWLPSTANLIVSNMAGPPIPLYLAGARVDAIFPLGPIAEGTGINFTVLSNMDRIDLGVMACSDTVPDVRALAADFGAAIKTLSEAARTASVASDVNPAVVDSAEANTGEANSGEADAVGMQG